MEAAAPFISSAGLSDVSLAGEGLEFVVYRGSSPDHGDVALRLPKVVVFENVNDPYVESKQLLEQELRIYQHLYGSKVPVPRPFGLVSVGDRAASLMAYVDDDGSAIDETEIGRILGLIHRAPIPPQRDMVALEGLDVLDVLPKRISRRWEEIRRLVPTIADVPPEDELGRIAAGLSSHPYCLLHMDMRRENLRVEGGKVLAVTDWSNAIIGPAAIDLYRHIELGKPGPEFLSAYEQVCPVSNLHPAQEALLRLDAAVMLTLVFLSEAPDPENAPKWLGRIEELVNDIKRSIDQKTSVTISHSSL